jgi:hypothetical protein
MREKQYTQAITFFATVPMYQAIKDLSDEKRVSLSLVMREAVSRYLASEGIAEEEMQSDEIL